MPILTDKKRERQKQDGCEVEYAVLSIFNVCVYLFTD